MENILKEKHTDEILTPPKHKRPSSKNDEFETPWKIYNKICKKVSIFPELDVAATHKNKKCSECITKNENALNVDWILKNGKIVPCWCNHPYSLHEEFTRKANQQFLKFGMEIIMLIPNNIESDEFWHEIIEPNRFTLENQKGHIHLYPLPKRIKFKENGKISNWSSRNGSSIVVWRKPIT